MKHLCLLYCIILIGCESFAQNFYRQEAITVTEAGQTYLNPWAGGINAAFVSEIDLNGDGIKDLFVFDASNNHIETFINMGTPNAVDYHYDPQYASKFPNLNKWAFLKDYNCDGKEDIFCQGDTGKVRLYRNDYSVATGLQFTLVTDHIPCTLNGFPDFVRCSSVGDTYPTFADVDGDGDLDILGWNDPPNQRVVYYQNKSVEMGLPCDSFLYDVTTQCWGKFQLAIGSNAVAAFGLTCPSPVPLFPQNGEDKSIPPSPSLLPSPDQTVAKRDDTVSSLFAIDIDHDNDMDLLIGDVGSPRSLLVINGGTPGLAQMVSQDSVFPNYSDHISLHSYLNHAYLDADNDGRKDIIATSNRECVNSGMHLYRDTGSTSVPAFSFADSEFVQRTMIDLGQGAYPSFFDYNGDGLMDMIVGNDHYEPDFNGINIGLALFKNVGTASQPAFDLIDRNFADFNAASSTVIGVCAPTFGDFDGDGDADMMVGTENGQIFYYKNNPVGSVANFTLFNPFFAGIDVGNYAMPCAVDLDRDGLTDLVVGRRSGRLSYFRNTGTTTNPVFSSVPTVDTLGGIILLTTTNGVTGYTAPFIYDDSGSYKMFIGCERGDVYLYDSIEGNINGTWHLAKTIVSKTEGKYTAVAAADINNDGYIDLAIGNLGGGLAIYYQGNPSAINEPGHEDFNFAILPNPACGSASIHIAGKLITHDMTYTVIDELGRIVAYKKVSEPVTTLNTAVLTDGIYSIRMSNGAIQSTKKLVVLH